MEYEAYKEERNRFEEKNKMTGVREWEEIKHKEDMILKKY